MYQFDDHIEIMNAGGLYGEARPENFPMVNDYRNPIVAEAMKEMKYVNMFNQGVKRVQDILRENGNKEAAFDVSKLTVFCVEVYSNEVDETTTQKTTQKILELIRENPAISTMELAERCALTRDGVNYQIRKLKKEGYIVRIGPDKGGHWEIAVN